MRRYKDLSTIKIREERIFCILLELFDVFEVGASINMKLIYYSRPQCRK